MKTETNQQLLDQLNDAIRLSRELVSNSTSSDYHDIDEIDLQKTITMARAAVERISGKGSPYSNEVEDICSFCSTTQQPERDRNSVYSWRRELDMRRLFLLIGVVESLRNDLERGYLQRGRNGVRNGVKSTVDPCSKLIRVKSRLDPSDI